MSPFVRLCLALSIVCWIVPTTTLANSGSALAAVEQQSSPPGAPPNKQQDPPAKPTSPRPNPDASGKYHVGDGVSNPKLIYQVVPEFSEKLRKNKIRGSCVVSITVDTDGSPYDVHIITSDPDTDDKKLHDAAVEMQDGCVSAAKQYRFEPGTYHGKPVPVEVTVEISFQIY
jgi:TonB family protein